MQILYTTPDENLAALQKSSFFAGFGQDALTALSRAMHLRHYARNEIIFWEGHPCAGLYILQRGSVKLFKVSPGGRELILRVFEQAATFNEVPVFDGGSNAISVAALEECDIWEIDATTVRSAVYDHPEQAQLIIQKLAGNLRSMVQTIEELTFYQVSNRLARLIEQLTNGTNKEGELRLTQDELAARLGTVREVVARSLRELERSGAIQIERRQIKITDRARLHAWANNQQID